MSITAVVLVTGSRDWHNKAAITRVFKDVWADQVVLFQGGARGADRMAAEIAKNMGWEVIEVPALWNEEGRAAGILRNERMLTQAIDKATELGCELTVFAFKENFDSTLKRGGTEDMVKRCKKKGISGTLVRH